MVVPASVECMDTYCQQSLHLYPYTFLLFHQTVNKGAFRDFGETRAELKLCYSWDSGNKDAISNKGWDK